MNQYLPTEEYMKEYRQQVYEQHRKNTVEIFESNEPEIKSPEYKENQIRWRQENKKHLAQYQKQYREENEEKIRTKKREYYLKNKDKILLQKKSGHSKKTSKESEAKCPAIVGIYGIQNKTDKQWYVGQSVSILKRLNQHTRDLMLNRHRNNKLQKAFNNQGIAAFAFSTLEVCAKEQLQAREHYYIKTLQSKEKGYNLNVVTP